MLNRGPPGATVGGVRNQAIAGSLVVLGALVAVFGVVDGVTAFKVHRWASAPGVVKTSTIGRHSEQVRRNNTTRERSFCWPEVTYEYAVGGEALTGTEVSPFSPREPRLLDRVFSNSYRRAETLANRYRAEQAVTVRYDPASPGNAYLEAELSFEAMLGLLLALVLPAVGAAMLIKARR